MAQGSATVAPSPTPVVSPAPERVQATPVVAAKPKRVCKAIEVTGSRLGKSRVCRTQEEWDEIARKSREDAEANVRRSLDGSFRSGN